MSRQLALDTIRLRPTDRFARTEYSLDYHHELIRRRTGLEPGQPGVTSRFYDACGFDFCWNTNDGLHGDWLSRGRCTDMGHAEYAADGSDLRQPNHCPFETVEEVWAFDPSAEYGLPDTAAQVTAYEQQLVSARANLPGQLVTGGYYKSIVSGCIQAFGWEMLLLAAADKAKFERVLDGFFRFTQHHMNAWAETSVDAVIQHDDFVWTAGAFLHPHVYREQIIPRYRELWQPFRAKGIPVLFCSDGNFTEFAEDLVAAGADGLIFEPCMDFGHMAGRLGDSTCLVGSCVDCRDLTFGKWETVKAQVDRTLEIARGCRGVILTVGNHMPPNIPLAMVEQYLDYVEANRRR